MTTQIRTAADLEPGDKIDTPAGEAIVVRVEEVYLGFTISRDAQGEALPVSPDFMPRHFDPRSRVLRITTKYGPDPGTPYMVARFPHEIT